MFPTCLHYRLHHRHYKHLVAFGPTQQQHDIHGYIYLNVPMSHTRFSRSCHMISHLSPPFSSRGRGSSSHPHFFQYVSHAFKYVLILSSPPNVGFPFACFSSTFTSKVPPTSSLSLLLFTFPNHSSLLLLEMTPTFSIWSSVTMSSPLRRARRLTPITYLIILISVVASRLSCLLDNGRNVYFCDFITSHQKMPPT